VLALPDQEVDEGEELMWVESRQPGDPPPTIMLEAPMAGLISKVEIAVGSPSRRIRLIEIVDLSVVEASARVPQHLASKLKKGLKAQIRVPGFPGESFDANWRISEPYADADQRHGGGRFSRPKLLTSVYDQA
jgi:cobalt-zinc-cadmium efflux system membrane fusion protein